MRGLKIWRRLGLFTTLREQTCSLLFEQHQIETFVSQLSDRIPIPMVDMQQASPFRSQPRSRRTISRLLSEQSSKSTSPTSDTPFHILVISANGYHKECFFG